MPSLHDLPDELLLETIHLLTPPCTPSTTPPSTLPTLLSLALSSRRLHDLCQPALSRPQALHRKWARVCASLDWSAGTTALLLLLDVLLLCDPGVAWYVRELDTRRGEAGAWALDTFGLEKDRIGMGMGFRDGNGIRWKAFLPPLEGRIRAAVARLDGAPRREWLVALDRAGDFDSRLSVTLLLSLLPELRALVVAEPAETVLPWLQTSPLASRLRKLRLNMAHAMLPSLRLPALTELVVEETRSGYGDDDDDMTGSEEETRIPALPIGVCPLTRLELIRSSLCPRDLSVILQVARREGLHGGLQRFTYSHQDHITRPGYQVFRGPSLIESLLIYSRQSLLQLDLDVLRIHYGDYQEMEKFDYFWYEVNITALGCGLKLFERLEMLKVSIEMLVEGWCIADEGIIVVDDDDDDDDDDDHGDADLDEAEIGNDGFGDEELGNDENNDAESGFKAAVQLPLWEVLPQSLQVLHICSKGYMHATAVVTEKLVALFNKGPDAVPRLRELLIDWQLFEPWKGLLEGFCKQRRVHLEYEQPSLPQC